MTTKTDELKPCPFCGCANIHITPDEVDSGGQWVGPVHVVCGGDCVAGQSGDDRESAIAAWNRRAVLQSQDRKDTFCVWHNDPETDNSWDTSCRQLFELYDGTPTENGMKFCCYCGGSLVEHIDHARRIEEGAK